MEGFFLKDGLNLELSIVAMFNVDMIDTFMTK